MKTSFATREGMSTAGKLVVDLTFSKGKKEAAGFELVKPATPRIVKIVVDKNAQRRSSVVPSFILRQPFVPKSGLI